MEVRFASKNLEELECDAEATGGFSPAIVKAFRKRMQFIRAAPDERDFYAWKSLHFEKLEARPEQHSMRLNGQFRLIIELEIEEHTKTVVILGIEDYH
ncbi:MAG: type II toxin-antitoxin system RelE/ParE family toxin [SAR202 cluster bacterium]|nr:type II toxin-antitoxin system RelE/ParE family toxin [SAR202 cluster bacterium]